MNSLIVEAATVIREAKEEILRLRAALDTIRTDLGFVPPHPVVEECVGMIDGLIGPKKPPNAA